MTESYLVPDYYPAFACKGGACRTNCCLGWRVTISLQDYFRLLGIECSSELRRKLDVALHVLPDATPDRYAEISPNWFDRCPLLDDAGLCMLQAECGEEALSLTCRYHPRGIRRAVIATCCCSASCEAVIEAFMHRSAPIRLIDCPLSFEVPLPPLDTDEQRRAEAKKALVEAVACLQDRRASFRRRLCRLVTGEEGAPATVDPQAAWTALDDLCQRLFSTHDATAALCKTAAHRFAGGLTAWQDAAQLLDTCWPELDMLCEHLMVNHLVFIGYPADEALSREELVRAVCAAWLALRYVLAGTAFHGMDETSLIDACTACFRVIEHSRFDQNAVHLLHRITNAQLCGMLML